MCREPACLARVPLGKRHMRGGGDGPVDKVQPPTPRLQVPFSKGPELLPPQPAPASASPLLSLGSTSPGWGSTGAPLDRGFHPALGVPKKALTGMKDFPCQPSSCTVRVDPEPPPRVQDPSSSCWGAGRSGCLGCGGQDAAGRTWGWRLACESG